MDRSYNGLFMSAFYPTCLRYGVVHPTKFNKAEERQPFLPGQPRAWPFFCPDSAQRCGGNVTAKRKLETTVSQPSRMGRELAGG